MQRVARIELYVPERAVARHEVTFQRWVETVTAPLRYVCVEDGDVTQLCTVPLGQYLEHFGKEGKDAPKDAPHRKVMSAFSGFSMARDQRGVWFREGTGIPEEDRVTIYTFLVDLELGEIAYYAVRERLAKTILRERNEQAVLLSRILDSGSGQQMELVSKKTSDYKDFAEAFENAAKEICKSSPTRIDLAWKQLHLFQLLQRDLMASAFNLKLGDERTELYQALFDSFHLIVDKVFNGQILDRMSPSFLATWVKIAKELADGGHQQAVATVKPHIEGALRARILEIADSLWRFQGHNLAGARDLDNDSCGVEAFAFVAGLNTWQRMLRLGLGKSADFHEATLQKLWTQAWCLPHFLLRDWRGLSYCLNERGEKELAAAFGLRTVDAIGRSGISDERTWYRTMRGMFPGG